MAAISSLLEPAVPAPATPSTPRVAEKSQGKNAGGFEHPAFNKVLNEHAAGPKPKEASTPAVSTASLPAEAASDPNSAPTRSTSAVALPPPLEPSTRPEALPQVTAKPLKLQTLLQTEPTPSSETQAPAPATDAPVLTIPLPETAATPPMAAESSAASPVNLVVPEAFLRWLDALKTFNDSATPQPAATFSSTAASSDRLPIPVAALLTAVAPALETLASNVATAITLPTSTPTADQTPFGLTVAALNTVPTTASPTAAVRLTTPLAMDNPDWPQQLGEQIRWRLGDGIQEARIEINPRELGAVDVRLSMDEQGLRVHLSAEQAKTRELLQNELPRLRESLQQGGILLADAQVGRESPGRDGAHPQGPQGAFKSQHAQEGQGRDDDDIRVAHVGGWRTRVGLLDDYA